jgi:hypothetical protein
MPTKTWAVGEEVLAADFNAYVQQQVVATFPNVAARDAWASPPAGALCVTTDSNTVWQRIGGGWLSFGATAGEFGGPGGNYATGTALITVNIPTAPVARVASVTYHALVGTQPAPQTDMQLQVNGVTQAAYRMPISASVMVNLTKQGIVIPANAACQLVIRNNGNTITLFSDPTFNLLSWVVSAR